MALKKTLALNCKDRLSRFGDHGALFAQWTVIVSWSFGRLQAGKHTFVCPNLGHGLKYSPLAQRVRSAFESSRNQNEAALTLCVISGH